MKSAKQFVSAKPFVIVIFSGLLFGIGMVISGMTDPAKVIGFLDITGQWDISLAFVMGGALAVFIPGYLLLIKPRSVSVYGGKIETPAKQSVDKKLISGAAIFGVGWGMLGICPGPAVTSLSSGNIQVFIFIAAMMVGSVAAKRFF